MQFFCALLSLSAPAAQPLHARRNVGSRDAGEAGDLLCHLVAAFEGEVDGTLVAVGRPRCRVHAGVAGRGERRLVGGGEEDAVVEGV